MRYMLLHKVDDTNPAMWNPTPEFFTKMGDFMAEAAKAGVFLSGDGLRPTTEGAARIFVKNGAQTVVDGPFAEAKEVVAGFAIMQVRDQAEAVEWGTRFADIFGDVDMEIEVRKVSDFD